MNSSLILIIFLFYTGFVVIEGNHNWFGEKWLQQNYLLKWKTDAIEKSVTFRVEVTTNGWVGLGFSKHGKTYEADMAIGWVNELGQTTFKVRHIS